MSSNQTIQTAYRSNDAPEGWDSAQTVSKMVIKPEKGSEAKKVQVEDRMAIDDEEDYQAYDARVQREDAGEVSLIGVGDL
jgi:hypothetical protein